jgi:hypothetical protein
VALTSAEKQQRYRERHLGVDGTKERIQLVEAGLLKREQLTPRAPWEVSRRDLEAEPVRSVIERLHRAGKLILQGGCAKDQLALFTENQGDDNARYLE